MSSRKRPTTSSRRLCGRPCRRSDPTRPTLAPFRLTRNADRARAVLTELYDAAVTGAAPGPVTAAALRDFPARTEQRIWLYALGKAAYPMAASAAAMLQRALLRIAGGIIVGEEIEASPYATVVAMRGDHPLPGRHSFTAAEKIGAMTTGMRADDVAIVLLSGGVSSLIAAPLRGMAESDLGQLFELLLASGLDIHDMNAVRKRFLRWGAGRLALALAPARTYAFIMSDVPGDDPASIGSGPCTPDVVTARQVTERLQRAGLYSRIAPAMRDHLASVVRGVLPETPKPSHPAFAHVSTKIIGRNALALDAVCTQATSLDLDVERVATPLSGDAATSGDRIATTLIERAASATRRTCIVWGGETTVQLGHDGSGSVTAADTPPSGGRCQELALAAARRLSQGGDAATRITLLAAGTDGRDGTTDAAGAFADASLWSTIRESGYDPDLALQRHESHAVLGATHSLFPRRSTGTNVMDVVIGIIE